MRIPEPWEPGGTLIRMLLYVICVVSAGAVVCFVTAMGVV